MCTSTSEKSPNDQQNKNKQTNVENNTIYSSNRIIIHFSLRRLTPGAAIVYPPISSVGSHPRRPESGGGKGLIVPLWYHTRLHPIPDVVLGISTLLLSSTPRAGEGGASCIQAPVGGDDACTLSTAAQARGN
jgi:hypothetical protein